MATKSNFGPKPLDSFGTKVTSVLSTSYSDAEFREALSLLDERGITNSAKTRRQIRLDLQKEVINCNAEIINEFGLVAEQLRRIKISVDKLNKSYDIMKQQLDIAHYETSPALIEASHFISQLDEVRVKQNILAAFRTHFILQEDEIASLTATTEQVDDFFFQCLLKAKKIRQDCELLLGLEHQTLGLELMDQTSKHINLGFQKLYKWVQREFKTLNLENPQMNSSIRRALRVLAERPSLFQNCLDFFAEARERILSHSFHCALTGTTSQGVEDPTTKPIDLVAHDSLRYVGDMLAWIHSATVSEREALEVLFVAEGEELTKELNSGRDAEVWRLVIEDGDYSTNFNALKALNDLVDCDISGAARIIRQRVEQVVQSNEEVIPAYKLFTLINFYYATFEKLLGPESSLLACIDSLRKEAMRQFRALIRDYITTWQGDFQHTPADLQPPDFLQISFKQLGFIIQNYESSLSGTESRENELQSMLADAFEPFLSGCKKMAASLSPPEDSIFLINCGLSAAACLEGFESTKKRAQKIRDELSADIKQLGQYQLSFFFHGSGLNQLMDGAKMGQLREITRESLSQAATQLDEFLPSALMDALDRLKRLQDSALVHKITEEAASQFCDEFQHLETAIASLSSGEDMNRPLITFPRTTAEIRVLLS